jgi:hypothetical protein
LRRILPASVSVSRNTTLAVAGRPALVAYGCNLPLIAIAKEPLHAPQRQSGAIRQRAFKHRQVA